MNKLLILKAVGLSLVFAACQNQKNTETLSETNAPLRMQATVSSVNLSRTTSDIDGTTQFVEGDKIGLFMPKEDESVCWSYVSGTGWKSETTLMWPNQRDTFSFCAYYPYEETATRSAIPMPDLSAQTGTLENIGTYDFLVAKRTCGFTDDNGNVSFTDDYAFGHKYSLVLITLLKNSEDATTTINSAEFNGTNAFGKYTYSFADTEGVTAVSGKEKDELSLTVNKSITDVDNVTIAVLTNPSDTERTLNFAISYTRDGIAYTAKTSSIKRTFASGVCYKYKIRIEKEQLSVVGSAVSDWTLEELDEDIVVKDTPAVDE